MVRPALRWKKKVYYRTPGGRLRIRYKREKTGKRKCGLCGAILHGVPHGKTNSEVRKLAKTRKRPERLFGGHLCHKCTAEIIELKTLIEAGKMKLEDVDPLRRKYVKMILPNKE